MSWEEVKTFLLDEVIELMDEKNLGAAWLDALGRDDDGKILAICIAVDVSSGAIKARHFADILNEIVSPPRKGLLKSIIGSLRNLVSPKAIAFDPREGFGKYVNTPARQEDLICSCSFLPSPLEPDEVYLRVLEIGDFIEYYVGPTFHLTRDPSDVERARRMFFDSEDGVDLAFVKRWWTGRHPNVWVMSNNDFKRIVNGLAKEDKASVINDALGLNLKKGSGIDGRPELVAVKYPKDFDLWCGQPTTLDATWITSGGYYLSFGNEDSWGRTQSCSGNHKPTRERVHSKFKNLTPGFRTHYIGLSDEPAEQRSILIDEGYNRFRMAIGARA
jgi:hypothetical protein